MASIRERNGKFNVIYSYTNEKGERKQKWETYETKAEAKRRKKEIEYKKEMGSFVVRKCKTLDELITEYVALYGKENWTLYGEIIKSNIEYDALLQANKFDEKLVQGIFEMILETVVSQSETILIASEGYPATLVKSKFLKLNYMHIDYVISCMKKNTTKVKNIKKYLLAALFNTPSTIDGYYQAEVNADMPHWAG